MKALLFLILVSPLIIAQTGVTGNAYVVLSEADDCGGSTKRVDILVDTSHLVGTGGQAVGLNAYSLTFTLSRPETFTNADAGIMVDWDYVITSKSTVAATGQLTIVGWLAEPALLSIVEVASIYFSGDPGDVSLLLEPNSSLGSRVVNGDGPGNIPVDFSNPPFTLTLTQPYTLDFYASLVFWLTAEPQYDFVAPDEISVLDYVKHLNCHPL